MRHSHHTHRGTVLLLALVTALACRQAERGETADSTPTVAVAPAAEPITQELVVYRSPT